MPDPKQPNPKFVQRQAKINEKFFGIPPASKSDQSKSTSLSQLKILELDLEVLSDLNNRRMQQGKLPLTLEQYQNLYQPSASISDTLDSSSALEDRGSSEAEPTGKSPAGTMEPSLVVVRIEVPTSSIEELGRVLAEVVTLLKQVEQSKTSEQSGCTSPEDCNPGQSTSEVSVPDSPDHRDIEVDAARYSPEPSEIKFCPGSITTIGGWPWAGNIVEQGVLAPDPITGLGPGALTEP